MVPAKFVFARFTVPAAVGRFGRPRRRLTVGVIAYASSGVVFWYFLIRPSEEEDMANRFGISFQNNAMKSNLWLPRLRAKDEC